MQKTVKIVLWVLAGGLILSFVLAFNAGQKRKTAVLSLDSLNAKLAEIDLRYKNAIQSYDEMERGLRETKKDLQQQRLFSESLKETLQEEQKKSAALRQQLQEKEIASAKKQEPAYSAPAAPAAQPEPQKPKKNKKKEKPAKPPVSANVKKTDRSAARW